MNAPSGAARVPVCGRCGVVAPTSRTSCSLCNGSFDAVRRAPPPGLDAQVWVAVRAGFTCRSCAFLAPLDHLDVDGSVECAQCGLRQAFDTAAWAPALAFAHATGDLAGPSPEGRAPHPRVWIGSDNPYAQIGVTTTLTPLGGGGALFLEAGPGHPICNRCAVPLEASSDGARTFTRCPSCDARATYVLPERAGTLCACVVGVVADEQSDRPRARVATAPSGLVALSCPACGAPLGEPTGERVVTCTFCKAVALMPRPGAAGRASGGTATPAIWWLLFEGRSPKRAELETPIRTAVEDTGGLGGLDLTTRLGKLKRMQQMQGLASTSSARAVEIAPESPRIGLLQIAVTAVAAIVALAITYPIVAGSSDGGRPSRQGRTRHR